MSISYRSVTIYLCLWVMFGVHNKFNLFLSFIKRKRFTFNYVEKEVKLMTINATINLINYVPVNLMPANAIFMLFIFFWCKNQWWHRYLTLIARDKFWQVQSRYHPRATNFVSVYIFFCSFTIPDICQNEWEKLRMALFFSFTFKCNFIFRQSFFFDDF